MYSGNRFMEQTFLPHVHQEHARYEFARTVLEGSCRLSCVQTILLEQWWLGSGGQQPGLLAAEQPSTHP